MKSFPEIKKNMTSKLQECYLNLFQICHAIRIVYAICQVDVEDETFGIVVFDEHKEICEWILVACDGVYGV